MVRQLITFVQAKKGKTVATQYVNAANNDGASAIHYAAQVSKKEVDNPMEDKEVIRLLLESGADVTQTTKTVCPTLKAKVLNLEFSLCRIANWPRR